MFIIMAGWNSHDELSTVFVFNESCPLQCLLNFDLLNQIVKNNASR